MSQSSTPTCDALAFARHSLPSVEEMRMVWAITRTAIIEAVRLGIYQASFHGFHIHAQRRQRVSFGYCVSINVAFGMTRCVPDMTLSLVSLNDCSVLLPAMRVEYILAKVQEPIACTQVM